MLRRKTLILFTLMFLSCLAYSHAIARSTSGKIFKDEPATAPMVLMLISAERVPKYLEYRDSKLLPVVRVKITYREMDKNRDNSEVKYEDLWYAGGTPVGLVRYHPLELRGSQIMLRINQYRLDDCELNPVANSIARVYLELALNDNSIYSCIVPNDQFDNLISAFRVQQFFAAGSPEVNCTLDPSIGFIVHTQTSGQNKVLQFALR